MRIYEFFINLLKSISYFRGLYKDKESKQIDVSLNKKLISLSPTSNAEFKDDYYDYLYNALYETDEYKEKRNKNIALSGIYGSGKSSIIKTFLRKSKLYDNTVFVSLGNYEKDPKVDNTAIEKSILQQIIYSVDKKQLPCSRINRHDLSNHKKIFNVTLSFVISLTIVLLTYIFKPNLIIENFTFRVYICLFMCIVYIVYLLINFANIFIGKINISIGDFGIEANNKKDEGEKEKLEKKESSLLNIQIDELVYYFSQTDKHIVIFEDIDRIESSVGIFSKLREINSIINCAISNKTIQFIYVVKDTLFDNSENRTKFFDLIIPILPYSSYSSSIEIFKKNLKDDDIDENIMFEIASFVSNPRDVYDIINEFKIFVNNSSSTNSKIQCLYLAAYKVLFPKRFDLLYENKGIICYYLSNDFNVELKKDYTKNRDLIIDEKIKKITDEHNEKISPYVKRFIQYIKSINYSTGSFYEKDEYIVSLEEIEEDYNNIYLLKDKKVILKTISNVQYEESRIFKDPIKDNFYNLIDNTEFNKKIFELKESKNVKVNLNKIEKKYKFDFIKKGINGNDNFSISIINGKENFLNNYEELLIKKEMFDYLTFSIISKRHDYSITDWDLRVLKDIYNGNLLDYYTNINNPKLLINRINKDNFIFDSCCLINLYKEILDSKNYDEYFSLMFSYLNEYKLKFLIQLNSVHKNLFKLLNNYFYKIWNTIESSDLNKQEKTFFVIETLKYLDNSNIPEYFITTLTNIDDILDYLELSYDEISHNFKRFDVVFGNKTKFDIDNKRVLNDIYLYKKFSPSLEIYEKLAIVNDLKFDKHKIIDTLYENGDEQIAEYIIDDLDELILQIQDDNIIQNNKEESVISFIKDEKLSKTTKLSLLEYQEHAIRDISKIDSSWYSELLDIQKIYLNWNNIYYLYKKENKFSEKELEIIYNNLDLLSNDKTTFSEFDGLLFELCKYDSVDIDKYKRLIDIISKKEKNLRIIPNIKDEYIDILIRFDLFNFDDNSLIKQLLDNESINNKIILINSWFESFKNEKFFEKSEHLLLLLNSDVDSSKKIEHILKYKDTNLLTEEVCKKAFDIIVENGIKITDNDIVLKLLNLNKMFEDKIKIFLNNCENELFNYDQALLCMSDKTRQLLEKKHQLYFEDNILVRKFLEKISTKGYFSGLKDRKKCIQIIYRKR